MKIKNNKLNKFLEIIKYKLPYIIIILLALFMLKCMMSSVFFDSDDGIFHITNILLINENIDIWNFDFFPDVIRQTTANNLGYGISFFYPNFPHLITVYILQIINIFGFEIFAAMKIVYFLNLVIAGCFMYKFTEKVLKNKQLGLLSAVLYMSLPYFLVDIFVRGAYNETFIFMFVPMVFLSLYYLFDENKYNKFYLFFIIGYLGLINSHLVLTVFFTICLVPYLLVRYKDLFNKTNFTKLVIATIIVLLISFGFIIGLFEQYIMGDYIVQNYNTNYEGIWYMEFWEIFIESNYLTGGGLIHINIQYICLPLLGLSTAVILTNIKKYIKDKTLLGLLCFFITATILLSSEFVWSLLPDMLVSLQFAFRLAIFIDFVLCIFAVIGIKAIDTKYHKAMIAIVIILILITSLEQTISIKYNENVIVEGYIDYNNAMGWQKEYLPQSAADNIEYILSRDEYIHQVEGTADIKITSNNNMEMYFSIENIDETLTLEYPKIWYIGYVLEDEEGNEIEIYENEEGLIESQITQDGNYLLIYKGTILYNIANIISMITIICTVIYLIIKIIKYIKNIKSIKEDRIKVLDK